MSTSHHAILESNEGYPHLLQQKDPQAVLIEKAQAGNRDALDTLFFKQSPALYQTALRLVGSPEEAEDVLQEGMLSAYRNLRRFEGRSQFSTWLTRIVINAAL